jgi:hypothetical protein
MLSFFLSFFFEGEICFQVSFMECKCSINLSCTTTNFFLPRNHHEMQMLCNLILIIVWLTTMINLVCSGQFLVKFYLPHHTHSSMNETNKKVCVCTYILTCNTCQMVVEKGWLVGWTRGWCLLKSKTLPTWFWYNIKDQQTLNQTNKLNVTQVTTKCFGCVCRPYHQPPTTNTCLLHWG